MIEILMINLSPRESECCICGEFLIDCLTGIPMYEGEPVSHDYNGEWGGFDACQACFDKYTQIQSNKIELYKWFDATKLNLIK